MAITSLNDYIGSVTHAVWDVPLGLISEWRDTIPKRVREQPALVGRPAPARAKEQAARVSGLAPVRDKIKVKRRR